MKKLFLYLLLASLHFGIQGSPISEEVAKQAATNFLLKYSRLKSGYINLATLNSIAYEGKTTIYSFSVSGGGWILISADDAATPVLAYSTDGVWDEELLNPTAKLWVENFKKEIYSAIEMNESGSGMQNEWEALLNQQFNDAVKTVSPLLTTNWGQGKYFNDLCPADINAPSGYNGHVPTGCVATAMAQIMKFHAFPAQGIGSYSYSHPTYGNQSANYGNYDYNWASMADKPVASNTAIATTIYHCGVAVNMNYGADGSGANSEDVPYAMKTYFNYDEDIQIVSRYGVANDDIWRTIIRSELDAARPVYYSGTGTSGGHAFVCDGYDASNPTKFHFNWGWNGNSNGYFAISALNTTSGNFNDFNKIVIGIKPRTTPDYICRITAPENDSIVKSGSDLKISVNTIKGTTKKVLLYIDNVKCDSSTTSPFDFTVKANTLSAGPHQISIKATDGTAWNISSINTNISTGCWQVQNVPFSIDSVNVEQIFPVNENVVWAVLKDYSSKDQPLRKFIKTVDGGATWTEGTVTCTTCSTMDISNIYAFSANKAYVCLNPGTGTGGAILVTEDGGTTWNLQSTAPFTNSWANWVYFFDADNGVCMGDSYLPTSSFNYQFCIYTTSNGGALWSKVLSTNLPLAKSGEAGTVNFFDAVGNTIWFGTGNGRVYKSTNKGLTWTVTDNVLGNVQTNVRFKDSNTGFAFGSSNSIDFAMKKTTDGGTSWTKVDIENPETYNFGNDFEYITGTDSTWINSGNYSGISITDNKSFYWLDNNILLKTTKFFSPASGWGGGYYSKASGGGIYKWIGLLTPVVNDTIVFRVKDKSGVAVQNAKIKINSKTLTTATDGTSPVALKGFGRPETYTVSKTGYSSYSANCFFNNHDTIDVVIRPANTVIFTVKNSADALINGATVTFNGLAQSTNINGLATFSEVPSGTSYPFVVTKTKYYAGYGLIDVSDSEISKTVVLVTDATNSSNEEYVISAQDIYPIPASEVVNIRSKNTITGLEIISMSGAVISTKTCNSNTVQISVSDIKTGSYLIKVWEGNKYDIHKFTVKH